MKLAMTVLLTTMFTLQAHAIEIGKNTELNAYADGQFNWVDKGQSDMQLGLLAKPHSGFILNDGGLFLTHKQESAKAVIELPFYMDGLANSVLVRGETAQAYVEYAYKNHWSWRLGQFDSLYGYEENESKDNFFSSQGILYNEVPSVHTGLRMDYTGWKNITLSLLVANHNGQFVQNKGDLDAGARVALNQENYSVSLGVLRTDPASDSRGQSWLVDLLADTKINKWTLEFESLMKWLRVPDDHSDGALFASAIYSLNPVWSLGVRAETEASLTNYSDQRISIGANAKMNEELTARFALTQDWAQVNSTSTKVASTVSSVDAVYSF